MPNLTEMDTTVWIYMKNIHIFIYVRTHVRVSVCKDGGEWKSQINVL
jgi:hypothetical protein